MTPEFEVFLFDGTPGAAGDADLFADEVEAGAHLGHRMLDLDTRVHLDEEKLALFPQYLDRARTAIVHLRHLFGPNTPPARAPPAPDVSQRIWNGVVWGQHVSLAGRPC